MLDDENREQDGRFEDETPKSTVESPPANDDKQKSSISADLIRGHINTIILRTLYERDKYGYEIIEEIEKKSHGQYELKQPTLYSALKRLENQGYIKAYWKTDEISSGGRRKYFTLTESGREVTEKNRAEWEYSRTVIDNLISDQDYDFDKPAPKPVDFKILKQSTSRVPTVKLEENTDTRTPDNENIEKGDDGTTTVAYSYADIQDGTINIEPSSFQFNESNPRQINHTEENYAKEITAENIETGTEISKSENLQNTAENQQSYAYNEEIAHQKEFANQYQPPETRERTAGFSDSEASKQTAQTSEPQAASFESQTLNQIDLQNEAGEQYRPGEIYEQPASYFRTEFSENTSLQQAYGEQFFENEAAQEPAPPVQSHQEQRPSNADDEQYKKLHENYLKLLDDNYLGNGVRRHVPEYGENFDTDKLLYNNKPVTERDYKNLINDMYSQTLRPQNDKPEYEPAQHGQPVQQNVIQNENVNINDPDPSYNSSPFIPQNEETRRAESDGLKIFTSDGQPKPNGKYPKSCNLGQMLFKSAAVTFIYLIIIFAATLICKSTLGVGYAYPFTIFAAACCILAVCAVMYLCGFGKNAIKPVTHGYIGISIVLTVIIILIVCVVAVLLNVDFTSAADVFKKLAIPVLSFLAIPLYTIVFYVLSKK